METVIIAIPALVSLTLTGALLVVVRRPDQRQGGMKDILETLVDPRVAEMRAEMNLTSIPPNIRPVSSPIASTFPSVPPGNLIWHLSSPDGHSSPGKHRGPASSSLVAVI